ncbi:MAG: UDP-N-acetylmuramoyl-L-alanyl-D-glutamate--2,6-diaminopimelate ligase [Elusimicrobia bacterium]|nr:UDP-N-acetylmuramoyl-L-alanyl-D-glutamate--2,6-diaminopimelate ligase [Elusimicrobiota bacterium]
MKLSKLLALTVPSFSSGSADPDVRGLSEDSRTAQKGFLFFARKGSRDTGVRHMESALRNGAVAVISEEKIKGLPVPVVTVPSIQEAEAGIAETFYQSPSQSLTVVGVTGTNGKTTFTYLLESIAREMGWRVGVIGTINYRLPRNGSSQEVLAAPNTTPNALELQNLLATMREKKTDLVLMEVSSHALALSRTRGIEFDGAVFTNLTQDHLDFHRTMEQYLSDKMKLFSGMVPQSKQTQSAPRKFCIINMDDPYGHRIASASVVTKKGYSIQTSTDFMAQRVRLAPSGADFQLVTAEGEFPIHLNLLGTYNVYNALACIGSARSLGIPMPTIQKGLENLKSVPGRLESVQCGQDFTVLVDYAHTEDALKNVLVCLRQFAPKRIITLFGCGGDRDRSKRPRMGVAATAASDWVILSSDNPRSEDPELILREIEEGIRKSGKTNYEIIPDREKAVEKCIRMARAGDILLIAGKGHESYQIFKDTTVHLDDRELAKKFLCCR